MKTMKIMKTVKMPATKSLYILAALLGLQFNMIFATVTSGEVPVLSNEALPTVSSKMLMPSTPAEATFEDFVESHSALTKVSLLSPAVPMVADFSDGAPSTEINLAILAPVTPKEADFEDETGTKNSSVRDLAPVTPAEADFEDHV
jgi:hypothetical protein